MRSLNATELKRLHRSWRRKNDARLAIVFDGVKGPYNVGSLLRSAAAMDVDTIYAIGLETAWTDAKVQKTAMGTHRFLQLVKCETAEEAVEAIAADGYRLIGVELATDALPLWQLDLTGDVCIALGHEDRGLSPVVLRSCDKLGYIPQFGKVGSLNVATAGSIACYEVRRQSTVGNEPGEGDEAAGD